MRVDILIYEDNIVSAVRHLIQIGKKPTLVNVRSLIREMVVRYGSQWVVEPTFDWYPDIDVVDYETADSLARSIASRFFDKIF